MNTSKTSKILQKLQRTYNSKGLEAAKFKIGTLRFETDWQEAGFFDDLEKILPVIDEATRVYSGMAGDTMRLKYGSGLCGLEKWSQDNAGRNGSTELARQIYTNTARFSRERNYRVWSMAFVPWSELAHPHR